MIKYSFLNYFRDRKQFVFGLLFPMLFASIYLMALGGLLDRAPQKINQIPIAVYVSNESSDQKTSQIIKRIFMHTDRNQKTPFDVVMVDQIKEGEQALTNGKVDYLVQFKETEGKLTANIKSSNQVSATSTKIVTQTIDSFIKQYQAYQITSQELMQQGHSLQEVEERFSTIQREDSPSIIKEGQKVNIAGIFFYSCLAYICFYFMAIGIAVVQKNSIYHHKAAMREAVSPISKSRRLLTAMVAPLLVSIISVYSVVGIYYFKGNILSVHWGLTLLLVTIGVWIGFGLGMIVALIFNKYESLAQGLGIAIPLILGAMSGMMGGPQLAFWIKTHCPIFYRINPISLISDALYHLSYYPTLTHFKQDIMILLFESLVIMIVIALWRKEDQYASI